MKKELESLLAQESNVKFAYLFGSRAAGKARESSDVDVTIFFYDDDFEKVLDLHHRLQKRLKKEIDLLNLNRAKNLYLLESVLNEGVVVKDHEDRPYYEVCKQHEIIDFKTFQKIIHAA